MELNKIKVRRSFIFTPGLNPEMFSKALASGADMVCIELEDGIAIKDKDEARKNTINALKTLEVKNDIELVGASFFEVLTAMSFIYFKKNKVDINVIETGIGGTYDTTNVIKSDIQVITPISYDHQMY